MYSLKHFRSTTIKWHKFLNSSIFICSNGFKWIYLFVRNKLIATQKNEFKQIIIFGINDFDQIFCKRSSAGSGQCCCRTQQPLSSIQRSRSVLSTFSSIQWSRSVLLTFKGNVPWIGKGGMVSYFDLNKYIFTGKELSLCHKLNFCKTYAALWCKPLIFQIYIFW